ncbi:hypothetical protein ACFX12_032993 [Malus domestica]
MGGSTLATSTPARKGLMRDFKRLQQDLPAGISGVPQDNNIMLWNAVILGSELPITQRLFLHWLPVPKPPTKWKLLPKQKVEQKYLQDPHFLMALLSPVEFFKELPQFVVRLVQFLVIFMV